ncbi:MAG TPA: caspase family protein [Candidatus Krumholzibacteria bacterium]|nr:caspase family protein [Candidatus Krumholzibacteria bacterium]HPD71558.1 caspase family protein [Candidatus Krumholzibacteria bacterium]HRY41509.1 caspase family protein [Candidatus Krumholzibacteria bacterium]
MSSRFQVLILAVATATLAPAAGADQDAPLPRQLKGDFIDYDRIKTDPRNFENIKELKGNGHWLVVHPVSGEEAAFLEKTVRLFPGTEATLEMATCGLGDHVCRILVVPAGGQPSEIFRKLINGGPYQPISLDLTRFAGQTITVRYECIANDWRYEHAGIDYFYVHQRFDPERTIGGSVMQRLAAWQTRGKFEKAADFEARTSPENRARMVETLQEQVVAEYTEWLLGGDLVAAEYDADAETFTLQIEHIQPVVLPVPLADAPAFDENLDKLSYTNPRLAYRQGALEFVHLEVTNPANLKLYTFDAAAGGAERAAPTEFSFPRAAHANPDAVAVVIGNRDYQRTRPVEFALNDASAIKRLLTESLGYQEGNVILVENANQGDLRVIFGTAEDHRGRLNNAVKPHESDVFVYYSGHGAPGLKDLQEEGRSARGYLLPVECDPQYVELGGYPLDTFYGNLAKIEARSVTVILDACFSGENVFDNISPVAVEVANQTTWPPETVVMAAASDRQVSCWFNAQRHGLFTYQLLAGVSGLAADRDGDGSLTFAELHAFVSDRSAGVPYQARRLHGVEQDPVIQGDYDQRVLIGARR